MKSIETFHACSKGGKEGGFSRTACGSQIARRKKRKEVSSGRKSADSRGGG